MPTTNLNRHVIKITIRANAHLDEIIRSLKEHGESGASKTRVVSELILGAEIPHYLHDRSAAVDADYCPSCKQIVAYHNGKCQECGTPLMHMVAMPKEALLNLMALARLNGGK